MTSDELDALPVVFGFETACRALSTGRNQGYRLLKQGQFPVRVISICGRLKVSKYDLLRYLGADGAAMAPRDPTASRQSGATNAGRPDMSQASTAQEPEEELWRQPRIRRDHD